jgi:ribonuclease Z
MELHDAYWKNELKLKGTPLSLKGHSRSTEMTCFYVPELNLYLDAGVHSNYSADHIFITHGHGDHIQQLNGIIKSQNEERNKGTAIQIYCPQKSADLLYGFVESYFRLNACNQYMKVHKIINVNGLECKMGEPKPNFVLTIKKRNYLVDVVKCTHTVPTLGYGFSEIRKRLKDEYKGLDKSDIIALKKTGTEITHEVPVPLFCFLGDTTHAVFDNYPEVLGYPNLIVECTFLEDEEIDEARKRKHMHWQNLRPVIESHPDVFFILIHFSLRYKDREIEEFFEGKLLDNMIVWTDRQLIKKGD